MSYAAKRHKAECADPRCSDVGITLKTYGGKLDWFCVKHAAMIDRITPVR